MKGRAALIACAVALLAPLAAVAADAVPTEMDPVKAARAVKLAEQLRCLVCQNQSIAESNAELANDLRGQIREQIAAGRSDDEIVAYMVNRYGDFVLYRPPLKMTTLLLWAGPALLLVGGALVLARNVRRRQTTAEVALTDDERARAEALLRGDDRRADS
jgi:cytochrome c-type biogenesis protein CcmH